jgi:uncharacterized metal-binding protein
MATEQKAVLTCGTCKKRDCQKNYSNGIPNWCMAHKYADVLENTKEEYSREGTVEIYKAASKIINNGKGKWTRVQEAIEFAKELQLTRIGLASCAALGRELRMVNELFTGAGFQVTSVLCQVGKVSAESRGIPELQGQYGTTCNPIAQAEILNSAGTELNFLLGLCLGHDILFQRHSKAPVSTLIVKDRITGQNPAMALYASQHRRPLWKEYCNKDADDE